jgi:hypothetical protein
MIERSYHAFEVAAFDLFQLREDILEPGAERIANDLRLSKYIESIDPGRWKFWDIQFIGITYDARSALGLVG